MRCRECFVQIEVDDIDAHIARTSDADECVHVRTVHVDETAGGVNDLADLFDVLFEDTDGLCDGTKAPEFLVQRSAFSIL